MDIDAIRLAVSDIMDDIDIIRDEDTIYETLASLEEIEDNLNELIDANENLEYKDILEDIDTIKQMFDETIYSLYSDEDEYENEFSDDGGCDEDEEEVEF